MSWVKLFILKHCPKNVISLFVHLFQSCFWRCKFVKFQPNCSLLKLLWNSVHKYRSRYITSKSVSNMICIHRKLCLSLRFLVKIHFLTKHVYKNLYYKSWCQKLTMKVMMKVAMKADDEGDDAADYI